jgi:hypothetical protein
MARFVVSNLNNSGAGSLRAAIEALNLSSDASNSIVFEVAGRVTLDSALPAINKPVSIDATSAPGYQPGNGPVVTLDFNSMAGLVFAQGAAGSVLVGLAMGNAVGHGITLIGGGITIDKSYVGLAADGSSLGNTGDGIFISALSANNKIGLNESGVAGIVSNVISDNDGHGISIHGGFGNVIVANRIGTNIEGTAAKGNGGNGIWVTDFATNNTIGGTVYVDAATGAVNNPTGTKGTVPAVFVVPPLGNLISGNGANGIRIDNKSEQNVLNGNFVGTTADGNSPIGNVLDGVLIFNADNNSLIGCTFVDEPFVYYNVLSGNGGNGLRITDSDNVIVQANFFGVGANNANLVGNKANGMLIDGNSQGVQVGGVIPLGNVTGGNTLNGIYVTDTVSDFITFNTFGGLFAFQGAAPNGMNGLLIDSTGGSNTVRTNVFSGNLGNGIEISGNARDVLIDPNIVGLNTNGSEKLANGGHGLLIGGTANNITVGGNTQSIIPQNTFSGNKGYGIAIVDQAHNNHVLGSVIGASVTKTSGLGNVAGGILLSTVGQGNLIGGVTTDPDNPQANLISGNLGNGVTLAFGLNGQSLVANDFGFDRFGLPVIPNAGQNIALNATLGNVIRDNKEVAQDNLYYGLQPQAIYTQIEALYVGYFGRAGDPQGLQFYSQAAVKDLLNGQSLPSIMQSFSQVFATSAENGAYAALTAAPLDRSNAEQVSLATSFINQTYQFLFSRTADTGGFDFWFDQLFSGRLPVADLVYSMATSAQRNDQVVLNNKLESSLYFDAVMEKAGIETPTLLSMQLAVRGVTTETTLLSSKLAVNQYAGESTNGVFNTTIFNEGTFITGVRGEFDGNVVLTGNQVIVGTGNTQALLYKGPMLDTTLGTVHYLTPVFAGETVVSSTFYGPNTRVFDSDLGANQVRAVGSYVAASSGEVRNQGMIYEGSIDGKNGMWTQINVPSELVGGKQVWNTILHSTMGDLAVGNYDILNEDGSGNAFIYNLRTGKYTVFDEAFGGTDQLTTAYGIWQDERGGSRYTIVGGSKAGVGLNKAFVAHYDAITEEFSNIRYYSYEGRPEAITHFEGITAVPGGFNLIATTDKGASFASITTLPDGSFSEAQWTLNNMLGADITTGNSIYQNVAMGIYNQLDGSPVNSYAGTIDQSFLSATAGLLMPIGAPNFAYGLTAETSTGSIVVGSATAGNVLGGSIGNDVFQGVQIANRADTFFTGGGADTIILAAGRGVGSHIGLYASNMTSDPSQAQPGTAVPSLRGSIVDINDTPQLGWWGQGSGKLGGPISDAMTNAGSGTGVSSSMSRVYNFESGTDFVQVDRINISQRAFSDLIRDVTPGSGPTLGAAVFSNLLNPGDTVTVTDANVLVFSNARTYANASELAGVLANDITDVSFGSFQSNTFNHYIVAYQDNSGSTRIADMNIQSQTPFDNTAVHAGKTMAISDMVQLVDVSIDQLYAGNIHFVL